LRTDDIPWDAHLAWYQRQLTRSDGSLLIGVEGDQPVGVARFDVSGGEAVITIAVAPDSRGRGVGRSLIGLVTAAALARPDVRIAVAYTRPDNLASQRAFLNNQYLQVGSADLAGVTMVRFQKSKRGP